MLGCFEIEIEHNFKESYRLVCDTPDDNYADIRNYIVNGQQGLWISVS